MKGGVDWMKHIDGMGNCCVISYYMVVTRGFFSWGKNEKKVSHIWKAACLDVLATFLFSNNTISPRRKVLENVCLYSIDWR